VAGQGLADCAYEAKVAGQNPLRDGAGLYWHTVGVFY
jgi:hypothetical protein